MAMFNSKLLVYQRVRLMLNYNVGPPQLCLLVYTSHAYYSYLRIISRSYWSYKRA